MTKRLVHVEVEKCEECPHLNGEHWFCEKSADLDIDLDIDLGDELPDDCPLPLAEGAGDES